MVSTGALGYHFGDAVNMKTIMGLMPEGIPAFGNIEPVSVMKLGTPAQVRKRTLELLRECGPFKNYVLSTGCDVPPGTKLENVDAFFDAANEYYASL
jgi:uroporphyrinogen decarboxylase